MIYSKCLADLTNLKTVLPQPAKNGYHSCLTYEATVTYRYRKAISRNMQKFSTHQSVHRSLTTAPSLDGASRAPHDSWWMGPEVLTIATIGFATPLLSY